MDLIKEPGKICLPKQYLNNCPHPHDSLYFWTQKKSKIGFYMNTPPCGFLGLDYFLQGLELEYGHYFHHTKDQLLFKNQSDMFFLRQKTCGIYFICDQDGVPIYIGQSQDILTRVRGHLNGNIDILTDTDSIVYISVPQGELNNHEAGFILRFLPKFNKSIPVNQEWMTLDQYTKIDKRFFLNRVSAIRNLSISLHSGYYHINDLKRVSKEL